MRSYVSFALAISFAAACGGDDATTSGVPEACNPLGGASCLLPWPSAAFMKEDATSPTGYRLDLAEASMPVNVDGLVIDPAVFNRWDGFSPSAPIVVAFPTGVDGGIAHSI